MTYEVLIAPSAEADLEAAFLWLSQHAPDVAVEWFNGALDAIRTLEEFPDRCSLAPESRAFDREIRQLIHGRRRCAYRILFDVSGRTVRILHLRHCARDLLTA